MKPKTKKFYAWDWADGGTNHVWAFTKSDAIELAEKIWPGHKPVNVRCLRSRKAINGYYKALPLMD